MSISQNFPEEGPTLNLNFAGSRTLDPRITFTRTQTTSNGSTYMGRDGLIKYAGPDEPRFDHRYVNGEIESLGLLVEESRSNYVRYSEELDNTSLWGRNGVGISTNATISPTGELTAEKIIDAPGVAGNQHWLRIRATGLSTTGTYTASTYLKFDPTNSNTRHLGLTITDAETGGSSYSAVVISTSGTPTVTSSGFADTSAGITTLPNGWYRAHLTFTNVGVTNELSLRLVLLTNSNSTVYDSDGSSGVYVWGAQLEQGAFPTSYIPTEGSTKTRTTDNASITGSNFTEWYNPSESTFFTTFRQIYNSSATVPSSTKHVIQAGNDITVNDNYTIRAGGSSTTWTALIRSASPSSLQFPAINGFGYLNSSTLYKASLSVDISLISLSLNGSLTADIPNTTTVNHTTPFNKLFIGSGTGGLPPYELSGHIAQLTYYPTRLTNSQLVSLTR